MQKKKIPVVIFSKRLQIADKKTLLRLVEAMELFAGDWSLASLAGRAIWNSCADDVSSAALHNDLEHLLNSLANSLGKYIARFLCHFR